VALRARAYPSFHSVKRLGVFLLPPGWDASPSQGYHQHDVRRHPFYIHLQSQPKVVGTLKPYRVTPFPPNQCWKIACFFQQKGQKSPDYQHWKWGEGRTCFVFQLFCPGLWVERGNMRVKCLAQEHNTVSPARARTRTALSRDERTNHEATAPPTWYIERDK